MVVWEGEKMKKSDYRKFIVRSAPRNDDFASMREVVGRRYRRLQSENKPLPDLILIDGGLGQLHAAAAALEDLGIINHPLAALAKKQEILFVLGREDEPIALDYHSPALHLVQQIRDEAHRFAVTFHRSRRAGREIRTEILEIPGVGVRTARRLLSRFGSVSALKELSAEELSQVVRPAEAKTIRRYFDAQRADYTSGPTD
jgi:excinuclease ABC subunit C